MYIIAHSETKCHRSPGHVVMCNIIDVSWDTTLIGGSSSVDRVLCEDGEIKLGSQCVAQGASGKIKATHEEAEADCLVNKEHLIKPVDIYQSTLTGIYAEYIGLKTFWVGAKKIDDVWVKPDGRKLEVVQQYWGHQEPSEEGDCVISDSNIGYHHRAVDCKEFHKVCLAVQSLIKVHDNSLPNFLSTFANLVHCALTATPGYQSLGEHVSNSMRCLEDIRPMIFILPICYAPETGQDCLPLCPQIRSKLLLIG